MFYSFQKLIIELHSLLVFSLIPAIQQLALLGSLSCWCLAWSVPPLNYIPLLMFQSQCEQPVTDVFQIFLSLSSNLDNFPFSPVFYLKLFHLLAQQISISHKWSSSLSFTAISGLLACITWSVCIIISYNIFTFWLFVTVSVLWLYHFLVVLNLYCLIRFQGKM